MTISEVLILLTIGLLAGMVGGSMGVADDDDASLQVDNTTRLIKSEPIFRTFIFSPGS